MSEHLRSVSFSIMNLIDDLDTQISNGFILEDSDVDGLDEAATKLQFALVKSERAKNNIVDLRRYRQVPDEVA